MKKLLFPLIAFTGIVAGMLVHKSLFSSPEPPFFMATGEISPDEAHKMSVAFRAASGQCQNEGCNSSEGIFELSEQTISGLLTAMAEIKSKASKAPSSYRCIMGKNANNQTILMMVPLDSYGNESLGDNLIRQVSGSLPCPTLCDMSKSKIVMGSSARGESCCK